MPYIYIYIYNYALLRGVGLGGREENRRKNVFFSCGKRHDNTSLKVQISLLRNFVVISQAPSFPCNHFP